jgi:hypothetical protein
MSDDLDLRRLRQIPDPFAALDPFASALPPPMEPPPGGAWPTRADRARRRFLAAAAALAYEAGWVVLVERRRDLGTLAPSRIALGLLIPLAASILALGAVSGKGRRGLGVTAPRLAALCTLPPMLFVAATFATSPSDTDAGHFWDIAVRCIGVTALLTGAPLALGALVFRHAFVAAATWRTAALGVACGGLAAAAMSLACWHGSALHIVIGHGTMMLVGGVAGALLGRRITRA